MENFLKISLGITNYFGLSVLQTNSGAPTIF